MAVEDWSTDPGANATVGGVNIAENCPAGNLNDAIRQIMAQIATWRGSGLDYQAESAKLTALAGLAGGNNQLPIFNSADGMELAYISPLMRELLLSATNADICNSIGAIRLAAVSLTNPGHISLQIGANSYFQIAFGVFTAAANGYTNVNYSNAFGNASFPVAGGVGEFSASAQDNNPDVALATTTGFQVHNASNAATCYYIAVGY